MLPCTSRLQKPLASKATKYASTRSIISARRLCSNGITRLSPWPCNNTLSPWHSMNGRLTRIHLQKITQSHVRLSHSHATLPHRAFIALGSNMGDRVAMIEQACKEMEATDQVKILQTSSLYETKAMYVLDQDNFVNGACEVSRNQFT
jgi:2-amino-4-hydroxy-6-hydroxymethyldihydropteridine diphosphokinase/dihydropteroate synthase